MMLCIYTMLRQLDFSQLMQVYIEGNQEKAQESGAALLDAENAFYDYLAADFFSVPGALYAVWKLEGRYISALRLEPFEDGLLLEALETAPEFRNQGYACRLVRAVQAYLRDQTQSPVYSHVSKRNACSLAVHRSCGFQVIKDHAVYIDGSVTHNAYTLCWR